MGVVDLRTLMRSAGTSRLSKVSPTLYEWRKDCAATLPEGKKCAAERRENVAVEGSSVRLRRDSNRRAQRPFVLKVGLSALFAWPVQVAFDGTKRGGPLSVVRGETHKGMHSGMRRSFYSEVGQYQQSALRTLSRLNSRGTPLQMKGAAEPLSSGTPGPQ